MGNTFRVAVGGVYAMEGVFGDGRAPALFAKLLDCESMTYVCREFGISRLYNDDVLNRSIDVQIGRLRRKIESDPARPRYIRTERGTGYIFAIAVHTPY
jgi:hypothetical protein